MKFTTSWDDGYADDLRIAKLLERFGMRGTFFVCPVVQHGQTMLLKEQIQQLGQRHEIGSHTLTHPKLSKITPELARTEIRDSKKWIEDVTGKPCTMFCYPYGDHNAETAAIVQSEGYRGARTVEQFAFRGSDPFRLPTSLHVYPFPLRPIASTRILDPIRRALPHRKELNIPLTALRGWLPFAKAMFRSAHERKEPWFHLWGHSAEVEKYGMWRELEDFLTYVQTFSDTEMVYNSNLL